jgi:Skp family chaperone for outer membrane proteins
MGMPFIAALTLLLSPVAHAKDMKFGHVDFKGAVENTVAYQKGMQRLEALKSKREKELSSMQDRIAAKEKALLGQSMAMSPDMLEQKQQDLKDLRKAFSRKQQDAQEELLNEKNRLDQSLVSDFYSVVQAYGKAHHFDYIFMEKASVIYANPALDITPEITKLLDKQK